MTSRKSIIQISGLKRSGKDFVAKLMKEIIEENKGTVEILSFAEPIKEIICTMLSIEPEYLDDIKNNKNNICVSKDGNIDFMTDARNMIMHFGNEAMKPIFGEDVWVKLMLKRINESEAEVIIIPDFRFNIEHLENALTVLIHNDSIINDTTHASENELANFEFDIVLNNTDYCLNKELVKSYIIRQTEELEIKYNKQINGEI